MSRIVPQKKPKGFLVIAFGGAEVGTYPDMETAIQVADVTDADEKAPASVLVTLTGNPLFTWDRAPTVVSGKVPDVIIMGDPHDFHVFHKVGLRKSGIRHDYEFAASRTMHEDLK